MIPNEYLYYYDFANEALTGMQAGRVRAEFLSRQQDAFYRGSGSPADALRQWEERLAEREGSYMEEAWTGRDDELRGVAAARETGGYGRLSLDLVDAMNGDGHEVMILNVANRSSLPFLDESAVVEVPCIVGRGGVVPVAIGSVPMAAGGADRRGPGGRARGDRGGLLPFPPARGPRPGPPSPRALRRGREPDPRPPPQGTARARRDAPMTVDVVCAGPPFLDLVFRGLSRLPEPGEEVLAEELAIVPGAMANVAFALRQLGVDAVVCSPVGTDPAGRLLQSLMAEAGIPWLGEPTPTTPVSVALPIDGERAFVTHFPAPDVDIAAIAAAEPRAIVLNLPLPEGLVPAFPARHA